MNQPLDLSQRVDQENGAAQILSGETHDTQNNKWADPISKTESLRSTSRSLVVSMVSNARSVDCAYSGAVEVVRAIRDGKWAVPIAEIRSRYRDALAEATAQGKDLTDALKWAKHSISEPKLSLPAVIWSGRFKQRKKDSLIKYSGLIVADLDDLSPELQDHTRKKLCSDPHLFALHISPSGVGLKVVYRVHDDADRHADAFGSVKQRILARTGVKVDESGKDLARLSFVSHDPEAYLNENAAPLTTGNLRSPSISRAGRTEVSFEARKGIASELLGEIEWQNDESGTCRCPGYERHTTSQGERDCKVFISGHPTIHCFHNSCREEIAASNRELRSRVVKEEAKKSLRAQVTLPNEWSQTSGADFARELGKALSDVNQGKYPKYVNHGGTLCRVRGYHEAARLEAINETVVRTELQEDICFVKHSKSGGMQIVAEIPLPIARDIAKAPVIADGVPRVEGIVHAPLLDKRGFIHADGFVDSLGLLITAPPWGIQNLELCKAVELLRDLTSDFRVVCDADLSRLLAGIFQPALVFGGFVDRGPMLLCSADAPSTGKGLVTNIRGAIYGERLTILTKREGGVGGLDESISSEVMSGTCFISLDNLRGNLGSQLLEAMLTETRVSCRIPYRPPVSIDVTRMCLSGTSNGVALTPDLAL